MFSVKTYFDRNLNRNVVSNRIPLDDTIEFIYKWASRSKRCIEKNGNYMGDVDSKPAKKDTSAERSRTELICF